VSGYLNGTWETSLFGRLYRWASRAVGPYLASSFFVQGLFGWPHDADLAPAETGRHATSPALYVLALFLGLLPLLPDGATPLMVAGIWGSALLWLVHKVMVRDFSFRASSAMLPLAAMLLIAVGATVQSVDRGSSALNLVFWVSAAVLFVLMVNMVRNTRDAAVFLGPVLIGACLMTLWGLYQVKYPPLIEEAWVDPTEGEVIRVFASMKNPNYLAEYLLLSLPPAIALWFQHPRRRLEMALIIGAMGLTLVLTGSRGGQLAFAIALALLVLMRFPRWTVLLVLGALVVWQVAPASITNRLMTAFSAQHTSNQYRINVWLGVLSMVKNYWALGTGLGAEAFGRVYQQFMLPAARAAHAHNTYLQMLAEMGVFGFLFFLWSLLAVVRRLVVVGVKQHTSLLAPAAAAALIGILVHGLAEHIWYNPKLLFAFWAVAGLGMGLALGDREDAAA